MPQARCFQAIEIALKAQPLASGPDGMPEARIWTVAVVGCGIGRSHIAEGY